MHIFVLLLGKGLKKGLCHGCLVHVVNDVNYYSLKPLSILSLGKILPQILEITPTYWLVSYLLADNWLICGLRAHYAWFLRAMSSWLRATVYLSLFIWKQCMIKQSLDFVISGIIKVTVIVISLGLELGRWHLNTSTLIIPDITKTLSNNCLLYVLICCRGTWEGCEWRHKCKGVRVKTKKRDQCSFLGNCPPTPPRR